jgi:membrane associated rhomboid family serine protease
MAGAAAMFPLYDDNPLKLPVKPIVTWLLILSNFLVFAIELGSDAHAQALANAFLGVTPAVLTGGGLAGLAEVVTLFTYMFLHADFWHILGNMVSFWVFGDDVEEALGRLRFLMFYVACGVIGALTFVLSDPNFGGSLIGASAAISGVMVAYMMLRPCAKITVLVIVVPLRIRAYWVIGVFALLQFVNLESVAKSPVAYWGHFGGMVAGAVLVPLMRRAGVPLFECAEKRGPMLPTGLPTDLKPSKGSEH